MAGVDITPELKSELLISFEHRTKLKLLAEVFSEEYGEHRNMQNLINNFVDHMMLLNLMWLESDEVLVMPVNSYNELTIHQILLFRRKLSDASSSLVYRYGQLLSQLKIA